MNKKLHETINLRVEIMSSKRQVNGETWSRGTNSRLPFDVNAMLNPSINDDQVTIHDVDILIYLPRWCVHNSETITQHNGAFDPLRV